jgi:hypothetical protein
VSSPYPRHECPRCGTALGADDKKCPNCGLDFTKKAGLSTGCVIALLFLVGYPVLVLGTCFVIIIGSMGRSSMGTTTALERMAPTIIFLAPAVLIGAIAWLVVRNRRQ